MTNKFFRIISSVTTLLLVFTLCACGADNSASSVSPSVSDSSVPSDTSSASPSDSPSSSNVFTVTYDGNGATSGTAPADSSSYSTGSIVTVLDNSGGLALEGSTFNGWNTSADGSGDKYAANDSLTMGSAAVTLYAQWVASTSTSPSDLASAPPIDSSSDAPSDSPSDSPSPSASSSSTTGTKDTAVPDKTTVASGSSVNFVVTTSQDVKQIQTYIDGVAGSKHTDYTDNSSTRSWKISITFTTAGSRKVRFQCTLKSGTTAYVPASSVVIKVTGSSSGSGSTTTSTSYSVTPTAEKDISADQSVTYTLTTPSTITSVCAVVDSVKQTKVTTSTTSGGAKKWTIKITFHKTGTRSVKFMAYQDTTVEKTFPGTALTVVVS